MNKEKEIELVKQSVIYFINKNEMMLSPKEKSSFIQIGANILCEKWEVGYAGYSGSFVTAFANNDLRGALAYADHINIGLMKDYMLLWYNAEYPVELLKNEIK